MKLDNLFEVEMCNIIAIITLVTWNKVSPLRELFNHNYNTIMSSWVLGKPKT